MRSQRTIGRHRKPSRFTSITLGRRANVATAIALVVVVGIGGGLGALVLTRGGEQGSRPASMIATVGPSHASPETSQPSIPTPSAGPVVSEAPSSASSETALPAPIPIAQAMKLGGDHDVAITPAEAKELVASFWPVYASAATPPVNTNALAPLEEGVAKAADPWYCGCVAFDAKLDAIGVAVPRQSAYPARFASLVTSGDGTTAHFDVLEFTRDSARDPWRLANHVQLGAAIDGLRVAPTVDSDGFAVAISTADRQAAVGLLPVLASTWQQAKVSGRASPPAQLDSGSPLVGARLAELTAFGQDAPQANGVRAHFEFTTDSANSRYTFVVNDELTFACGTITETTTWTPPKGHLLAQDASRDQFYPSLPPGEYEKIVDTAPWQVCVATAPGHGAALVLGQDGREYTHSVGTTAPGLPTPTSTNVEVPAPST